MGIPISVIGAFVFLGQLDFTLNMITMFSFIVVLGVVVDDAIVIGENVFTKITQGHSPVDAAIMGASEIAYPVISSVVTTIVASLPNVLRRRSHGKAYTVLSRGDRGGSDGVAL